MTSEEMLIVKTLRDAYGDSISLYQMYRTLAPRIFEIMTGDSESRFDDVSKLIWLNFAGGVTAEYAAGQIFDAFNVPHS